MAKKKAASPKKSSDDGPDFEASLAEVERIVADLEGGNLGLTESLQQYETGIKRLKRCHTLLDAVEQKVSLLSGFDADGNPITEPVDQSSQRTGAAGPLRAQPRSRAGDDSESETVDDEAGLF